MTPIAANTKQGLSSFNVDQIKEWFEILGPIGPYVGAIVIFFVGKFIAKLISKNVAKLVSKSGVDSKLSDYVGGKSMTISGLIGTLLNFTLLIFVIVFALDVAGLDKVTEPLQGILDKMTGAIGKIAIAGLALYLGLFLAKIVKSLIENILTAARIDERLGSAAGTNSISKALATAAYALIALFVLSMVLGLLDIPELSAPISNIVEQILSVIPNILLAGVLVAIGIYVAKLAQTLITSLLDGLGVDAFPGKIGLDIPREGKRSVSNIAGFITFISIIVIVTASAIQSLEIELLQKAAGGIVNGYFNILLALLILGAGFIAARFAFNALKEGNLLLAKIARGAIIVLVAVAALRRSGIAPEITDLPYQYGIMALALATGLGGAIAIGLGGKEFIASWLEKKKS